jgi:hypothetical protein
VDSSSFFYTAEQLEDRQANVNAMAQQQIQGQLQGQPELTEQIANQLGI